MLTLMLAQTKLQDLEREIRCLAEARAAHRSQRAPAAIQTEPAIQPTPMLRRVEG